jgi:hypothetical protein
MNATNKHTQEWAFDALRSSLLVVAFFFFSVHFVFKIPPFFSLLLSNHRCYHCRSSNSRMMRSGRGPELLLLLFQRLVFRDASERLA